MEDLIQRLTLRFYRNQASPYYLTHNSFIGLGDESSLQTYVYQRNELVEDETIAAFDEALLIDFNEELKREFAITHTINHGLCSQWDTDKGDTYKIHICDHSIYLTIFNSGQY